MLEDIKKNSVVSLIVSVLLVAVMYIFVIGVGNFLVEQVFEPAFDVIVRPVVINPISNVVEETRNIKLLKTLFIGVEGRELFGLIYGGIFVTMVMIFPFVLTFYLVNIAYAVLGINRIIAAGIDPITKLVNLSGQDATCLLLGTGCKVPAIMATETVDPKKSLLLSLVLIAFIPCGVQQGIIFGVLNKFGSGAVIAYIIIALIFTILGVIILGTLTKVKYLSTEEVQLEPTLKMVSRLFKARLSVFFKRDFFVIAGGIGVIALLNTFGIIDGLARILSVLSSIIGISPEGFLSLVVTFIQSESGMGMLATLDVSPKEALILAIVGTRFFACMGILGTFYSMQGPKKTIYSAVGLFVYAILVGIILNVIL